MLVILGFGMVLVFMVLIMTKRLSPAVALITVPTVFALFTGIGWGLGDAITPALKSLAPTMALLSFAIAYFGTMLDVGLFDPLVRGITVVCGTDPVKIVVGTAVLATVVSLDGDGSTTFIVVTSALLPIYLKMGLSPVVLTCVAGLANGTMNIIPWGGPTVRAAAALQVSATDVFVPMLPSLGAGLVVMLAFAWHLGVLERRRLAKVGGGGPRSTPACSPQSRRTASSQGCSIRSARPCAHACSGSTRCSPSWCWCCWSSTCCRCTTCSCSARRWR